MPSNDLKLKTKTAEKDKLGFLGEDFQYRLVSVFMRDTKYFKHLERVIEQDKFTVPELRTITGIMKDYYHEFDVVPSYEILLIKLREKTRDDLQMEMFTEIVEKLQGMSSEAEDYTKELGSKFFIQQHFLGIAKRIIDLCKNGSLDKFEDCQALIESAGTYSQNAPDACSPFEDIEGIFTREDTMTIPTGIDKLDDILNGGLDKGNIGLIIGPSGFGKVQPYDAKIVTPTGLVEMRDIKVGSKVIGADGKPHNVIGVYPHTDWDFYKVTFSDGVSTECGMEHLWNVNTLWQRSRKKYIPGKSKRLPSGRYSYHSSPDYSYRTMSLREIVDCGLYRGGHKAHNFKVQMPKPTEFNEVPLKIHPYLMGYMLGDGSFVRHSITVGKIDIDHVLHELDTIGVEYGCTLTKRGVYYICLHQPFANILSEYYGSHLTSSTKYIHTDYLYNSIENRILLLNGLMDTDGTCSKNGYSSFSTKSLQLAKDVRTLVLSLGGYAKIEERKNRGYKKTDGTFVDCGTHYNVQIILCDKNIPLFRLKRKQDRVRYKQENYAGRFIHSVEFSRKCDGQCIKVDAEDELYLTDDFIVTHNTSLTTSFGAYAATCKIPENKNKGFKVLQIVFEDKIPDIGRKYASNITQVETRFIGKDVDQTTQAKENLLSSDKYALIKDNVKVMRLETNEYTATDIKNVIKSVINGGFYPDMVIVDYLDCIKPERGTEKLQSHEHQNITMRKFENYAKELNVALWLPTQSNREGFDADDLGMKHIQGSVGRGQIAQVVIGIGRQSTDISQNRATLKIMKNRSGQAGIILNVYFNNGTSTVFCDNNIDFGSDDDFSI